MASGCPTETSLSGDDNLSLMLDVWVATGMRNANSSRRMGESRRSRTSCLHPILRSWATRRCMKNLYFDLFIEILYSKRQGKSLPYRRGANCETNGGLIYGNQARRTNA